MSTTEVTTEVATAVVSSKSLRAGEFAVKQWKCANHFTGMVAPGVAEGGSCQKTEGIPVYVMQMHVFFPFLAFWLRRIWWCCFVMLCLSVWVSHQTCLLRGQSWSAWWFLRWWLWCDTMFVLDGERFSTYSLQALANVGPRHIYIHIQCWFLFAKMCFPWSLITMQLFWHCFGTSSTCNRRFTWPHSCPLYIWKLETQHDTTIHASIVYFEIFWMLSNVGCQDVLASHAWWSLCRTSGSPRMEQLTE